MRHDTKALRLARLMQSLASLGFTAYEANTLRRAQLTLHRWDEQECGDGDDWASWAIERDEVTGKPFRVTYPHKSKSFRTAIPDREKGALRRIGKIVADRNTRAWVGYKGAIQSMPGFVRAYHQGDCRGCALYLVRNSDIPEGSSIDSCYNRGLAVCV